jgi:hypothetical protein
MSYCVQYKSKRQSNNIDVRFKEKEKMFGMSFVTYDCPWWEMGVSDE